MSVFPPGRFLTCRAILSSTHTTGEWEGVTATFSPTGEPQQLPEQYVPGAFRDWGVELYDWQSQVSCNAAGGHLR